MVIVMLVVVFVVSDSRLSLRLGTSVGEAIINLNVSKLTTIALV